MKRKTGPDTPRTPAQSRTQRLAKVAPPIFMELLEARRFLTVTCQIVSGVLEVTSDSAADSIDVWNNGTDLVVTEDGVDCDSYNPNLVTASLIKVFGNAGNDTIDLWGWASIDPQFPALIYGGDDDDEIDGTAQADTIYGGVGYDTVHAWGAADRVYGGTGTGDSSDATTGFDLLYGGAGNDTVRGEGGGDTIYGDAGADVLYGGDGSDWIDANTPTESGVNDILDGGSGTDCGWWSEVDDSDSNMEGNLA